MSSARRMMRRWGAWVTEPRLAALLFVVAMTFALAYLTTFVGTIGLTHGVNPYWFYPSIMFAAGYGLVGVPYPFPTIVTDFLDQKTARLAVEDIPVPLTTYPMGNDCRDRFYLLLIMGWIWRVFGISWYPLKVVVAVFYGLSAASSYGLFRLGMRRTFSLIGTVLFLLSPLVLDLLPSIRDFSKGPFMLASMLILGCVLSKKLVRRDYWLLAALLGGVIGLGFGFRSDLLVCVPPSVFVLVFCARGKARLSIPTRFLALVLACVCFGAAAWPARPTGDDAARNGGHYLLQGFSWNSSEDLDVHRASYDAVYSTTDLAVYALAYRMGRRAGIGEPPEMHTEQWQAAASYCADQAARSILANLGVSAAWAGAAGLSSIAANAKPRYIELWSAEADAGGRLLVREIGATFPADVVTRAYAGVLKAVKGVWDPERFFPNEQNALMAKAIALWTPLAGHLRHFGLCYAALAFLICAARSLWLAGICFLLMLYFGAYPSMSFQLRHVFHLAFVPLWFAGFLLDRLVHAGGHLRHAACRDQIRSAILAPRRWWNPAVKRMVVFAAGACALLALPLYPLRAYQCHTVEKIKQQYAAAELEPLKTEVRTVDSWTIYHPLREIYRGDETVRAECLVVELEADTDPVSVYHKYADPQAFLDAINSLSLANARRPVTLRYFFPVNDFSKAFQRELQARGSHLIPARFDGLGLPTSPEYRFKGMYRVKHPEDFPMLLYLVLPSDPAAFRPYQSLSLFD